MNLQVALFCAKCENSGELWTIPFSDQNHLSEKMEKNDASQTLHFAYTLSRKAAHQHNIASHFPLPVEFSAGFFWRPCMNSR